MAGSMLQRFQGTFNFNTLDAGTTLTNQSEIILQADTTSVPCTINLPQISTFFGGQATFRFKIFDYGRNASVNNITINTFLGDTIDGGQNQFVINVDGTIVELIITGSNSLAIIPTTPVAKGALGGTVFRSDTIITSAQILTLNTTNVTIVPAQGVGIIIKPIAIVSILEFNSIGYLAAGALTTLRYGSYDTLVSAWDTAFITNTKSDIYDASYASLIASGTVDGIDTYANKALQVRSSAPITTGNSNVKTSTYWIAIQPTQ